MEVNILDYATEGVLSMECEDRWQRLVACLSKSLNKTEINYEIHDKEMLVVIRGLDNQKYLLESTNSSSKSGPTIRIYESAESELQTSKIGSLFVKI